MPTEAKWFALYTTPRAEKKVSSRLGQMGIVHYLPLTKVLKKWSDRKKVVEEPLFKSYMFVKISEAEYYKVLGTSGVVKFVSFGGQAESIPEDQIMIIKRLLMQELPLTVSYDKLEKGTPVEVIAGPLMGTLGELISQRGESRLAVNIHTIDTSIIISIPENYVEPVTDQHKLELLESLRTPKFASGN